MSELEGIRTKINNTNDEIKKLKEDILKYKQMNKVIDNVVLAKLSSAKKSLKASYDQIRKGYSSTTADKKIQKLKDQMDEINTIANELKGKILSESEKQIRLLESKVRNNEQNLKTLNTKLSQLENNVI